MKRGDAIVKRQKGRIIFRNGDMDFMFTWAMGIGQILGYAPTQALRAGNAIKDGDPDSWCEAFAELGRTEAARARSSAIAFSAAAKGQAHLGAAYAYRMALQYADVRANRFRNLIAEMEKEFRAGAETLGLPLRSLEIPFEGKSLPGYFLGQPGSRRPVVLMIGGGDTFREDLFYFAGYPGWKRDYDVLMVDLPGQGSCPDRGFPFRADMYAPQKAAIDWLEAERGGGARQAGCLRRFRRRFFFRSMRCHRSKGLRLDCRHTHLRYNRGLQEGDGSILRGAGLAGAGNLPARGGSQPGGRCLAGQVRLAVRNGGHARRHGRDRSPGQGRWASGRDSGLALGRLSLPLPCERGRGV